MKRACIIACFRCAKHAFLAKVYFSDNRLQLQTVELCAPGKKKIVAFAFQGKFYRKRIHIPSIANVVFINTDIDQRI